MIIEETSLEGAFLIKPEPVQDFRGLFSRTFCKKEFKKKGIGNEFVQCNTSYNEKKGTLRGMHFQIAPYEEDKLVRCTKGEIHDVIIDLRKGSGTFGRWLSFELTENNRNALYIPKGFAHGFQTLCDQTEVFYQMTEYFVPEAASGIRWNDPYFNINWPISEVIISRKDSLYPDFY